MGTCVMGKLEAGTIRKGETLIVVPNKTTVTVEELFIDHQDGAIQLAEAAPGDNIKMKLKGVEEEALRLGFVLCRKVCRRALRRDFMMLWARVARPALDLQPSLI